MSMGMRIEKVIDAGLGNGEQSRNEKQKGKLIEHCSHRVNTRMVSDGTKGVWNTRCTRIM